MICEILFYSKSPERVFHFFCTMFEPDEVLYEDFSCRIKDVLFIFKEGKPGDNNFSFSVDDISELENLKSRIEFFYYKESLSPPILKIEGTELVFKDFEKRQWRIKT